MAALTSATEPKSVVRPAAKQEKATPFFQPKLIVNTPGDRYEQEADRVADQVMAVQENKIPVTQQPGGAPVQGIMRRCADCQEEDERENGIEPEVIQREEKTEATPPPVPTPPLPAVDFRLKLPFHPPSPAFLQPPASTLTPLPGAGQGSGMDLSGVQSELLLRGASHLQQGLFPSVLQQWQTSYGMFRRMGFAEDRAVQFANATLSTAVGNGIARDYPTRWESMERQQPLGGFRTPVLPILSGTFDGPAGASSGDLLGGIELWRKENTAHTGAADPAAPAAVSAVLSSNGGQPLDGETRQFMEDRIGHDFSQVRVHTDKQAAESAEAVHARAYTSGHDVVFGAGEYQPGTQNGKRLLAHELVHVRQQRQGAIQREENSGTEPATDLPSVPATPAVPPVSRVASVLPEPAAPARPQSPGVRSEPATEDAVPAQGAEQSPDAQTQGEGATPPAADDFDLIDFELAEHERWAGSFGAMGIAGSDERARFLIEQAGQGANAGAASGLGMGFVMGAIGSAVGQIAGRRLATLAVSRGATATPVPGLGSAIGGVMAVAGLAMRDWGATAGTISRFGTGEGYEGLANDLEAIAEALDVATQVMDVLAGVLGAISVGMWVGAVLSAGALSPLAATLSAIALGINLATTAIGLIINFAIRPTVTALRALHTFESRGDPTQIEAEGQTLQSAAAQVTGALAGAAGGKLGGRFGARVGTRVDNSITRIQARQTGGPPAMTATATSGARLHVEAPEAPVPAGREANVSPPVAPDATPGTVSRPAATEGPVARAPGDPASAHPPESFADLADVIAELNASPSLAARLEDTRAPLPTRDTPWNRSTGEARAHANVQASEHRAATGMTGDEVQAGHTAAARHAYESGIRESDWDTQEMMNLHSRLGQGLDATVTYTDANGRTRTRTRTRHTAQEMVINDAVNRARQAQGRLTPQGQLDAARYTKWMAENTPWDQRNVDMVLASGPARPEAGPPVDPATGRVILPASPAPSSPVGPRTGTPTPSPYAAHSETLRTTDRAAAMAQYHAQISADTGRESGVWRDGNGNYFVMQGDSGSVAPPAVHGPLELVYHSHPTETGTFRQGMVSQPSQAGGDIGVLQYQHAQGPVGRRQQSELHFPTYDPSGTHTGYGTTRFAYDPTHPLPLQVETTVPGGRPTRQRYRSFADFEQRTGIGGSGMTSAEAISLRMNADAQLRQDVAGARQRVDAIVQGSQTRPIGLPGMREGTEAARPTPDQPAATAYTTNVAGLRPGETMDIPINPAYPAPPGTTAELEALRAQVATAQSTQVELGHTGQAMSSQAERQRAHRTQLDESQEITNDLVAGRTAHQEQVSATTGTNTEQQTTVGSAISSIGRSEEHAAGLYTLVSSLRLFRGMADLFSYLPGSLGRRAERASEDAGELITTLNRVHNTEDVQSNMETGRQTMTENARRITTVAAESQRTETELSDGQRQVNELEQANDASLANTQSVQQQAVSESTAAAASEQEATTTHDDLRARLQVWAQEHRQAREVAIEDAMTRLTGLGYQVTVSN